MSDFKASTISVANNRFAGTRIKFQCSWHLNNDQNKVPIITSWTVRYGPGPDGHNYIQSHDLSNYSINEGDIVTTKIKIQAGGSFTPSNLVAYSNNGVNAQYDFDRNKNGGLQGPKAG